MPYHGYAASPPMPPPGSAPKDAIPPAPAPHLLGQKSSHTNAPHQNARGQYIPRPPAAYNRKLTAPHTRPSGALHIQPLAQADPKPAPHISQPPPHKSALSSSHSSVSAS